MIKIILVRHGQTENNKAGLAQGHNDSDLTEEGLIQLEKIKEFLKNYKIDVVFSSSLGRALKTAKKICENRNVEYIIDDNLKEINWGELSKLSVEELLKKWSEYYKSEKVKGIPRENIRPKNGENSFDHIKRVKKVLDKIIKDYNNKTVVLVAHGGTNKVIIGLLRKVDPEEFYNIEQNNACINLLELSEKGNLLKSELNITKHLKEEK
jgi:broad specificity phosphatase PhoE